ncbi:Phosphodiest-domain-containing protein [Mucidula mucida]|nr:Phosphodiest-domain-containing protein [Mucidula mucida]
MHDKPREDDGDYEREGLLTGTDSEAYLEKGEIPAQPTWSRNKLMGVAVGFIVLLVCGITAKHALYAPRYHPNMFFNGDEVRSNGTHDFKRTVLIVSIDGLRADYLDRGLTPHLLNISKQGLRAKSMQPIFPTLTFPNHWALMTGLHAESHGIVGNNFWDPRSQSEFHYNREASAWIPDWWLGEPPQMWETTGKAGVISANLMWPGPPKTSSGATPTYFVPWKDKVPLQEKLDQIMAWIDLPFEQRPQLIMGYEPSLDQAGHATGPMSARVNATLQQVDVFAKNLHLALEERNLTDIVDIVFVSDHGMTDTSHPTLIYMDDILGEDGLKLIEHEDGWPSMGLRFIPQANESYYYELLVDAADRNPEKFDVFTHETMPERYHFANNERIAPIYIVPKIGYTLTTKKEGNVGMTKGNHGYDNDAMSMQAMFVAHGPFTAVVKTLHHQGGSLLRPNKGWHSTSEDTYVMERFQNVEVYNLVMKLLGIEAFAASTNGTKGFWDQYF